MAEGSTKLEVSHDKRAAAIPTERVQDLQEQSMPLQVIVSTECLSNYSG